MSAADASGRGGRFPPTVRIRARRDFERVLRDGRRVGDERLLVWGAANECGQTRLGLMIGRKHGGAVRRNRIRRVLREAFRLARADLPTGLDLICSVRIGAAVSLYECMDSLRRLAKRVARQLASK